MNTAVYSQNLKVYMRWGWFGEYANVTTGGTSYELDDPYGKRVDVVLDRNSKVNDNIALNYYSEITHFDLRYDDEPYNFPPFANSIQVDEDGTRWLRIPVNSPLMQSIVLTGEQVNPGDHKFEVRCVDLQDEYDPIPATIEFKVVSYIEPDDRNGILVIDDDPDNTTSSPEAIVNDKYANMLSDFSDVTFKKRSTSSTPADTYSDTRSRNIAFSDLMNYKVVLYHSDHVGDRGNLDKESDGITLYLLRGGNMIFSHTHLLAQVLDEISKGGTRVSMLRQMGLPDQPLLQSVSGSLVTDPHFQYAAGVGDYPTVNLQYGTEDPSFNPLVNLRHGLSAVSYFPSLANGEAIYTFGCKPVDYPSFPPSQATFDKLNGQIIGVKNNTISNGKVYTFSFPLSFMKDADTKALMNRILSEIM